jgi:hypothetical protein
MFLEGWLAGAHAIAAIIHHGHLQTHGTILISNAVIMQNQLAITVKDQY